MKDEIRKLEDRLMYGKNADEKIVKILLSVKMDTFQSDFVEKLFKRSFAYLSSIEDYERAAELKGVEKNYLENI